MAVKIRDPEIQVKSVNSSLLKTPINLQVLESELGVILRGGSRVCPSCCGSGVAKRSTVVGRAPLPDLIESTLTKRNHTHIDLITLNKEQDSISTQTEEEVSSDNFQLDLKVECDLMRSVGRDLRDIADRFQRQQNPLRPHPLQETTLNMTLRMQVTLPSALATLMGFGLITWIYFHHKSS